MNQFKVEFESIPWESPASGVRFKAFTQAGEKLRLVEFTDEFVEPDWCLKRHIGYVLEGEVDIDFDGVHQRFKAGQGMFIPGGEDSKHKASVIGRVVRLVLVEDG